MQGNWVKGFDTQATVNWITRRLIHLGWAHDRIRKEYVEWLWLKTGTWPQWLLAVAKAEGVFLEYDPVREIALRRWIRQGFDRILATADREDKSRISEETEVYRELFKLARLTFYDVNWWITEKLVAMMANGKGWNVKWFEAEFGQSIGLCPLNLDRIRTQAIEIAKKAGRYGVAAGLIRDGGQQPDKELVDQAAILG